MLSVKPKGGHAGDPSDNHPKSRVYHPYSDRMLDAAIKRDTEKFNYRRECAAFDRQRKRLNDMRKKGRVFYG